MNLSTTDIIHFIVSAFFGGGIGFTAVKVLMESSAKKALKDDITAIYNRIDEIEDDYVTCKFCTMQHNNLNTLLESMNKKLDILIEKR